MARLYLVRHGEAAAGYGHDRDPGLSERGRAQAEALVATFEDLLGGASLPIRTSPLRRCQETAMPLATAWGVEPVVDPLVAEVAAPTSDLAQRSQWLRRALASTWSELEPEPVAWRARLLDHLRAIPEDSVVVTHFVVINAAIGAARGDNSVMVEPVANTSITVLEGGPEGLHLVESGAVGESEVL